MAQVSFGDPVYFQVPDAVQVDRIFQYWGAITTGDFNEDGDPDVAVATSPGRPGYSGAIQVTVFLNDGLGGFENAHWMSSDLLCRTLECADFDRDGHVDLVVGESIDFGHPGRMAILSGVGDGTFVRTAEYETHQVPDSVAVGDFDGDGDTDIIVGDSGYRANDGEIELLRNRGDGTFDDVIRLARLDDRYAYAVAVGNVDEDSDLEVAVASQGHYYDPYGSWGADHPVFVLLGNGDASTRQNWYVPQHGTYYDVDLRGAMDVCLTDWDGDGDRDLVAIAGQPDSLSGDERAVLYVFRNKNHSTDFKPLSTASINTTWGYGWSMDVGDIDGDGAVDVALTSALFTPPVQRLGDLVLTIVRNNDDACEVIEAVRSSDYKDPRATALVDVDGDGQLDAVALVYNPLPGIVVMKNTTPRMGPVLTQGALVRGEVTRFEVMGAPPETMVYFVYSLEGPGPSLGISVLGGLSLDVLEPVVQFNHARTDENGYAWIENRVPANMPLVNLTTQAVVRLGVGGSESVKSTFITDRVQ